MSERTGIGFVAMSILESIAAMDGASEGEFVRSIDVVAAVENRFELGKEYAYRALCDLARDWLLHLTLVDFRGDVGEPGVDASPARYTAVRLSPVGQAALESHWKRRAPIPVGLINGNTHVAGMRPPLDPMRVIRALHIVIDDPGVSHDALASVVGLPAFPGGCQVVVEGRTDDRASLRLQAILTTDVASRTICIEHFPPPDGAFGVAEAIAARSSPGRWVQDECEPQDELLLPFTDIHAEYAGNQPRIVVTAQPGTDLEDLAGRLLTVDGITRTLSVDAASPASLVRDWATRNAAEDLSRGLAHLTRAIQLQHDLQG